MPPQRKFKATVTRVLIHDDLVRSFFFKPSVPVPTFKAGQFLQLAIDEYEPSSNWPDSRAFSIASGKNENELRIIVSRKGEFTSRLFDKVKAGSEVWIRMPFGVFNLNKPADSIVLIAGGTGISPFIPLFQSLIENRFDDLNIHLFYGVKNANLIIIDDLLEQCEKKNDEFHYSIYCENKLSKQSVSMKTGILPVPDIIKQTIILDSPEYYLSGPGEMISSFRKNLSKADVPQMRVHYDEWE